MRAMRKCAHDITDSIMYGPDPTYARDASFRAMFRFTEKTAEALIFQMR